MRGIKSIFVTGICAIALAGCSDGETAQGPAASEPVPVTVVPLRTADVQRRVEVFGTLVGQEDVIISNKVPGKVIGIFKDVGDRVAPGETLAQLLQADYQLTVNERQFQLQESLAALGVSEVPPDSFDFESVPSVRRARLQAQNAQQKLDRGRQLKNEKPNPLISEQEFSDLETEAQVVQSAYQTALIEAKTLLGTARTRKAQVAIAEQAVRDTTIRAPRPMMGDGSAGPATQPVADASGNVPVPPPTAGPTFAVAARFSSEGELNGPITRMFRLVIDDPLKLRASVPERYAGQLEIGQKVTLRVESEREPFTGAVTRINPQIDPANRSFEVEAAVPNPNHLLKPGAFTRADIETHLDPNVLLVPEKAIVSFAGVKKIYSVKDDKAVEIAIETGAQVGDWVEVTKSKNLSTGTPIVVQGVNRLAGGVPVTVRAEENKAPAPTTAPAPRERGR